MRLAITGTPCTGKTTLAAELAAALKIPLIRINDVVSEKKLFTTRRGEKEKTVKMNGLERELNKILLKMPAYVVEGHLACEFALPVDKILVLRANPALLEKRMKKRKYPAKKTAENLLAECLDYCLAKAEENYPRGKIVQVNCSKPPSVQGILSRLKSGKSDSVNWFVFLAANEKRLRLS